MERLYGDWIRVDANARLCNSSKGERMESVWVNYDPERCSQTSVYGPVNNDIDLFERPARYGTGTGSKLHRSSFSAGLA